ncbi:MAG: HEAT repeat domain-containing protein [Candidatus Micrarchaeia archaeon]
MTNCIEKTGKKASQKAVTKRSDLETLIKKLDSKDWSEREKALDELAELNYRQKDRKRAQEALLKHLSEPDEDVRYALYNAIGEVCDEEALPTLEEHRKIVSFNKGDPTVQTLIEAITKIRKRTGAKEKRQSYGEGKLAKWIELGKLLSSFFENGLRSPYDGAYAYLGIKAKQDVGAIENIDSIARLLPFDHRELGVDVFGAINRAYRERAGALEEVAEKAAADGYFFHVEIASKVGQLYYLFGEVAESEDINGHVAKILKNVRTNIDSSGLTIFNPNRGRGEAVVFPGVHQKYVSAAELFKQGKMAFLKEFGLPFFSTRDKTFSDIVYKNNVSTAKQKSRELAAHLDEDVAELIFMFGRLFALDSKENVEERVLKSFLVHELDHCQRYKFAHERAATFANSDLSDAHAYLAELAYGPAPFLRLATMLSFSLTFRKTGRASEYGPGFDLKYASAERAVRALVGEVDRDPMEYVWSLDEQKLRDDARRALDAECNEIFGVPNSAAVDESAYAQALKMKVVSQRD